MTNTPLQEISLQEIKHAYSIAAMIVKKYGDVYLPLFQRMHAELIARQEKSDMKTLALSVAETHTGK